MFVTLLSHSRSLACLAKISNRTKYLSLNNKPCLARPTHVDLNLNKLHYYPFMISLDRCHRRRKTLNDFASKICFPNETEDVKLIDFNMIRRTNE